MTVSCPGCNKKLLVDDIIVKDFRAVTKLQTCGKIVIQKKGRVIANLVEAHQGLEVRGIIEAKRFKGGPVRIAAKAQWKGDCQAPLIRIDKGALISGGRFDIPNDDLGLADLVGFKLAGQDGSP